VAGANLAFKSLGDSLGQADICSDVCVCLPCLPHVFVELKKDHPLENGRSNLFLKPNQGFDSAQGELNLCFSPMIIRKTKSFEAEIGFPSLHQNCGEIFRAPVLQMCCNKMTANAMLQIDLFAMKMFGILVRNMFPTIFV